MKIRAFRVTLISAACRVVRTVIAPSSVQAARIALRMMPDEGCPVAVICAPLNRMMLCAH